MAQVTYDSITNSADLIKYLPNSPYVNVYPDSNSVSIYGPIWLPRIYGKDLTAFEIASSGKIAITINDIHSLDVSNSNYGAATNSNILTTLNTKSNYALEMMTNNRDLQVVLDSYSNDMYIHAASNIFVTTDSKDLSMVIGNNTLLNTSSNIDLSAINGSLQLYANNSNSFIRLLAADSNIDIFSSCNITTYAVQDYALTASNDYILNASRDVNIAAQNGAYKVFVNDSNTYMTMDTSNYMTFYAKESVDFTASNSYIVNATSNVSVTAQNGNLQLWANDSNMYMLFDGLGSNATNSITLRTANDFNISTSNSILSTSKCNVSFTAEEGDIGLWSHNSNMSLLMDHTTDNTTQFTMNNFYISASNSYELKVTSNVDIIGHNGNINLMVDSSNMYIALNYDDQDIVGYSASNFSYTASNNWSVNASSNINIAAQNGTYSLYVDNSNSYLLMNSMSNDTTQYTTGNYNVTGSNNYNLNISDSINIAAQNGSFKLFVNDSNSFIKVNDSSSSNINVYTALDIDLSASNNFLLNAQSNIAIYSGSNTYITAHESNIYIRMNMPADTLDIYALSNMTMTTSNSMYVYAATDMTTVVQNNISTTACNDMRLEAQQTIDIVANSVNITTNSDISYTAQSNLNFYVKAAPNNPLDPIFTISGTEVKLRGDLVITGSINTSNITSTSVIQNNLKIEDKNIILANVGNNSNNEGLPADGVATNDGAGIIIDGFPGSANSNEYDLYRKLFTWNYGTNGTLDLGTSNLTTESYWDLQGGSFRITKKKNIGTQQAPDIKDLSFGFRINEADELELVKKFWDTTAGGYLFKRIARFGRVFA
jgi:uncharacterized protein (DUF2345 family)